jgi:hypothetical protein
MEEPVLESRRGRPDELDGAVGSGGPVKPRNEPETTRERTSSRTRDPGEEGGGRAEQLALVPARLVRLEARIAAVSTELRAIEGLDRHEDQWLASRSAAFLRGAPEALARIGRIADSSASVFVAWNEGASVGSRLAGRRGGRWWFVLPVDAEDFPTGSERARGQEHQYGKPVRPHLTILSDTAGAVAS